MNNLYNILKNNNYAQSEEQMWNTVKIISDFLINHLSDEDNDNLNRCVYGAISNRHYNKEYALEDIENMKISGDETRPVSYISFEQAETLFSKYKSGEHIESYNVYDFWVTLNMIMTDNYVMLHKWFPEEEDSQLIDRIYTMSVNWLNDNDNPFGTSKIWCYFNIKR